MRRGVNYFVQQKICLAYNENEDFHYDYRVLLEHVYVNRNLYITISHLCFKSFLLLSFLSVI